MRRRLDDAISKFGENSRIVIAGHVRHISHLSYNHYTCLENVIVFFSPCVLFCFYFYIYTGAPLDGKDGTHYIVSCETEMCGVERESSRTRHWRMHWAGCFALLCLTLVARPVAKTFSTPSCYLPQTSMSWLPPRLTFAYARLYNVWVVLSSFCCVPETPTLRKKFNCVN